MHVGPNFDSNTQLGGDWFGCGKGAFHGARDEFNAGTRRLDKIQGIEVNLNVFGEARRLIFPTLRKLGVGFFGRVVEFWIHFKPMNLSQVVEMRIVPRFGVANKKEDHYTQRYH
jgi:hypothetical protein